METTLQTIGQSTEDLSFQKSDYLYKLETAQRAYNEEVKNNPVLQQLKQEIDKCNQGIVEVDNQINEKKKNLFEQMMQYGIKSIETLHQKFTIKKNPGALVIDDESKLTEDLFKIKKEVDKIKIKEYLKNGVIVEGVHIDEGFSLLVSPK